MTVTATAFNNTPEQTDDKPRLGAWEDVIRPGMKIIAVSHDLLDRGLDRGTQVAIDGFDGEYTVLDKMDD
ncbi:MAG: hypothetical protein M3Z21_03685, partial [Pseudomonadota bacterium]|nr:hypothetical protein [Pseudomonadota bacterium]